MDAKHKVPFFDTEDIALLKKVGGKKYDKTDPIHIEIGEKLKNGVWEKTLYWCNLVVSKLEKEGFIKLLYSRLWQNSGNFKGYTWMQICKKNDKNKGVFFTVGISENEVTYKLDYQYINSSTVTLSTEQKSICKSLLKNSRISIPTQNLDEYSWDKLANDTVAFIIKYTSLYDEVIEKISNFNQKRIARITYNDEGWVKPSGKYGKSEAENSFEAENGYGHEEWLFDFGKVYKGYHYAFLEPIQKEHQAYVKGNPYDVVLFTINGETKQRYYIGEIFNVEVISEKEAEDVCQYYKKKGWLDDMIEQVKEVSDYEGFYNWKGLEVFNVRFRVSDVKQADSFDAPIPPDNPINNLNRYSFAHYKKEYALIEDTESDTYNFDTAKDSELPIGGEVKKRKHERQPKTVEIEDLHQAISDKLFAKFKNEGRIVKREVGAGYGNNRIDLVEQVSDGDIFYEIKTYPSLKTSIRMAIGQLLEYSMWTTQNKAKELIVVTQPMPDFGKVKEYFAHIRKTYNIPLYYQSFDVDTNELSEKV